MVTLINAIESKRNYDTREELENFYITKHTHKLLTELCLTRYLQYTPTKLFLNRPLGMGFQTAREANTYFLCRRPLWTSKMCRYARHCDKHTMEPLLLPSCAYDLQITKAHFVEILTSQNVLSLTVYSGTYMNFTQLSTNKIYRLVRPWSIRSNINISRCFLELKFLT